MKFNFKRISAIAVSALMACTTLGFAAAASYPAPFVSGGVANVAVVYGTGAGVSNLDQVQAANIQESLGTFVSGGNVTITGGEAFKLEKSSNKFNFGNALNGIYSTLDNQRMDFLADGTYNDGNVDEDYTQTIALSSAEALSYFADANYNSKIPTFGFRWTNDENILKYDFIPDAAIPFNDLNGTEMPLMGKTYYVLDSVPTKITLLDSAEKVVLKEGDTVTVGGKTVSIEFIDATDVKFNVDGEITTKLGEHDYYKLNDGSYIVANSVDYNGKDSGVSSSEFSIGEGKITLKSGENVEVNDKDVQGLVATMTDNSGLTKLDIAWNSHSTTFLTENNPITMPVFKAIGLAFGGLDFPATPEVVSLDNGEQMTLHMGNYELPLFNLGNTDGSKATLGEDSYPLVTKTGTLGANYTAGAVEDNTTGGWTSGLNLMQNDRFIVTELNKDLSDVDTMYYEVSSISFDGKNVDVELTDLIGNNDLSFTTLATEKDVGDLAAKIGQVNDTNVYLKFSKSNAAGTLSYDTAVSQTGLEVTLPAKLRTDTMDLSNSGATGVNVTFTEADKDGNLGAGMQFVALAEATSNNLLNVESTNVTTLKESTGSKVYTGYVPSDLTSKVTLDESGDEHDFSIDYYGQEVSADVQVIGGDATVSSGTSVLGNILVKDTEVGSVATKNLIVVGGSCINSAAAALVGGAKCGAAWTEATGIGSGQFLIKGYATSSITSKLALLVAGYDAADTVKATTYLTNKVVDTSKAYKGTTSTEVATVIQ
jgi:hypothetical protein